MTKQKKLLLIRWSAPLLWMLLIFVVSAQSRLPHAPEPALDELLKKFAHFLEYFILCFLWMRAMVNNSRLDKHSLWLACLISALYAVSDEIHQAFVPGRHPSLADLMADWAGIGVAAVLINRLSKKLT